MKKKEKPRDQSNHGNDVHNDDRGNHSDEDNSGACSMDSDACNDVRGDVHGSI